MVPEYSDLSPSMHILIAEDSPTQAERLLHILRQRGWNAVCAANGREALEMALSHPPALIISDVVMPEMDGYQLTHEVKAHPALRDVPVILVTTMSDPQDVIRGLECGADCFILKPYDDQHLVGRVRYILLNRQFRNFHDSGMGVEIYFNGQRHYITADRLQILNLLLSTYDAAIQRNQELSTSQEALTRITAEVQAGNRFLDSVIENMPVAIFVKDAATLQTVRTNRAAEELLNRPREELLSVAPFTLLPEAIRATTREISQHTLAKREAEDVLLEVPNPDRSVRSVRTRMAPVLDEYGDPSHLLIMCDDVTDQMRAEAELKALNAELQKVNAELVSKTEELERAQREAEAASRAKSAFLAAMSHEIRTPMNGVVGMIDVLHQSSLKPHQTEMVDLIRDSAFSLLGIIEDILDFSKIEAGRLEIDLAAMSVSEVVEKVCSLLDNLAAKKRVEFTLFIDPAIPAQVQGDALRIRQVLINIINNAIKFSSGTERTGRVSVRATMLGADGSQTLELRVTDNGIGMDKPTRERLFKSFMQADVSTTRRFGGTGLGLAISHQLVALMGGHIAVHSVPGEGSTFTVCLPLDSRCLVPVAETPARADPPGPDLAGLPCLVVGAPQGLADGYARYLENTGAVVERAADLDAARTWAAERPPGLGVWLVDLDGVQAAPGDIAAAASRIPGQDIRVVALAIARGEMQFQQAAHLVVVNANALSRARLLRAVALASGRIEDTGQEEHDGRQSRPSTLLPPGQTLRRVLVTEDNETNQKVVLRQLALLGITADVVGDGQEALERWRSGDYSLLLTDLHMPRMDGYQLAVAIRAQEKAGGRRRTPIIALSANALKDEARRCRTLGMDDYLSKPAMLGELRAMLQKWLPADTSSALTALRPLSAAENAGIPVDVRILKHLVGDEPGVVGEFLHDFLVGLRKAATQIGAAVRAAQPGDAATASHKLKSSARAVGAVALGDLCERMEHAGDTENQGEMSALLPAFEREVAAVEHYLASLA